VKIGCPCHQHHHPHHCNSLFAKEGSELTSNGAWAYFAHRKHVCLKSSYKGTRTAIGLIPLKIGAFMLRQLAEPPLNFNIRVINQPTTFT
jgi:hypothetical protein